MLEIARTVPDIVWALLFIIAFGIGPLAGILAITVHTIGAQGKLFAEVNENISPLPIDGHPRLGRQLVAGDALRRAAAGPAELHVLYLLAHGAERAAAPPSSASSAPAASATTYSLRCSFSTLRDAGAILLIVVATIMGIDILSERFRHRAIGKAQFRDERPPPVDELAPLCRCAFRACPQAASAASDPGACGH